MPNMLIKVPQGAYPSESRARLVSMLNTAAATAETIPDDPAKRFFSWVQIDEVAPGAWTCGGHNVTEHMLPCLAMIDVPAGVLDGATRARYAQLVHCAFQKALPSSERRQLVTSIMLHEVADGAWAANGNIWHLPDFARAAGYGHLQTTYASGERHEHA